MTQVSTFSTSAVNYLATVGTVVVLWSESEEGSENNRLRRGYGFILVEVDGVITNGDQSTVLTVFSCVSGSPWCSRGPG